MNKREQIVADEFAKTHRSEVSFWVKETQHVSKNVFHVYCTSAIFFSFQIPNNYKFMSANLVTNGERDSIHKGVILPSTAFGKIGLMLRVEKLEISIS